MLAPAYLLSPAAYRDRLAGDLPSLSAFRLTVRGLSGARYAPLVYAFNPAPFADSTPQHFFSNCGRFVIIKHRDHTGAIASPAQYHVYFKGLTLPDDRWAIRTKQREPRARLAPRHKQTPSKDA